MKSYLSLVPISAKVRKRQNRMTVFCIVIAVFLVTSVFSMADMGIRMEKLHAIEQHGNWHFQLHGISEEEAAELAQRQDVAAMSRYDAVNYKIDEDYFIGSSRLCITGGDEAFVTEFFDYLVQGEFPTAPDEILLTENAASIYLTLRSMACHVTHELYDTSRYLTIRILTCGFRFLWCNLHKIPPFDACFRASN